MIASGRREQSQGLTTLGGGAQVGLVTTKKPLNFPSPRYGNSESAPTAPPQVVSEVESVTNSAWQYSLEAAPVSPIVFVINKTTSILDAVRTQPARQYARTLCPSVYTASRSRTLSAPSVRGA